MSRVIGRLAEFLVKQKIPGSTQYAGPPFRKYEFGTDQLKELKEKMEAAVNAYPEDDVLKGVRDLVNDFVPL